MAASSRASLLPEEDAREAALFFVVTALCFLAALSALAARSAYGAAESWSSQVEGEMTIRLVDASMTDQRNAVETLTRISGVVSAQPIDRDDAEDLLTPWFGENIPDDLPLPRLIAVETDPLYTTVQQEIRQRLTDIGLDIRIDAHEQWASDLNRAMSVLRTSALGAVALLACIAIAVIAFATHAALLARRDVVDVLHLAGAQDSYISSLFEGRFFGLGLRAGALGAVLALGVSAFLVVIAKQNGDRAWLLPRMSLDLVDGLILGLVPIAAGLAAMLAARLTVMRSLSSAL